MHGETLKFDTKPIDLFIYLQLSCNILAQVP